ncbi:MAG: sugar ABC transporter permease [Actinomycetaceae bacterium]|nr:sugar ABC transporter permease [Actinomycetaceae bacterium]
MNTTTNQKTRNSTLDILRQLVGGDFRQFAMIGALIFLIIFFEIKTGGTVLKPGNLMNIISGNSYVLILALGMLLVIVCAQIDLSVGSVAAFVGIIVAITARAGLPPILALILGLLVGLLVGTWQGFWVAWWGVPGFITTLAGMLLFRGANQWIGESETVSVPELFRFLGAGYLPDIAPNMIPFNLPTMILGAVAVGALAWSAVSKRRRQKRIGAHLPPLWIPVSQVIILGTVIMVIMWLFATGEEGTSFPIPGLILAALTLFYSFLTQKTTLGRAVYAVGGNPHAASLSGVSVKKTLFFAMANMSVLAAVSGILFIGRSTASGPSDGVMWELDAIAAVFIGGAAVTGGVGTVMGTIVGGLVMAVLNNGLQLLGVGAAMTQVIKGLVLLAAVAVDVWSKKQGKPSIIGTLQRAWGRDKKKTTEVTAH